MSPRGAVAHRLRALPKLTHTRIGMTPQRLVPRVMDTSPLCVRRALAALARSTIDAAWLVLQALAFELRFEEPHPFVRKSATG